MRKRVKLSQNFIKSKSLVRYLVRNSGITPNDVVYEIGAGQGFITDVLGQAALKVIAYEIDENLYRKLEFRFQSRNIEMRLGDFLQCKLPDKPFKLFSNIPFRITADVIKKLTLSENGLIDAYIIVQKEAANKFISKSQMSAILYPWFDVNIVHNFRDTDFYPKPHVDVVLLHIRKRDEPLVSKRNLREYEDFVTYTFNQFKSNISEGLTKVMGKELVNATAHRASFIAKTKPSELNQENWIELYRVFSALPNSKKILVKGSFGKQLKAQKNIKKINRTRLDKKWKQQTS